MVDRLGVYTSLAGVVENAASLSDGKYSGAFLAPLLCRDHARSRMSRQLYRSHAG